GNERQLQCGGKSLQNLIHHWLAAANRCAEISLYGTGDIPEILHRERIVEPKLLAKAFYILRGSGFTEHDRYRIARYQMAHHKCCNGHTEDDGDRQQQAF